jgi:hypothetical protein
VLDLSEARLTKSSSSGGLLGDNLNRGLDVTLAGSSGTGNGSGDLSECKSECGVVSESAESEHCVS